jgi:hypothetical protein
LRLYPAHPGNPRNRIQGESPPLKKGHTVFAGEDEAAAPLCILPRGA